MAAVGVGVGAFAQGLALVLCSWVPLSLAVLHMHLRRSCVGVAYAILGTFFARSKNEWVVETSWLFGNITVF